MKKYESNDQHQKEMLSLLEKDSFNEFNEYEKATLYFAISKSYEDQKNYEKSSDFFKKANNTQKKILKNYSVNSEVKLFEKINR